MRDDPAKVEVAAPVESKTAAGTAGVRKASLGPGSCQESVDDPTEESEPEGAMTRPKRRVYGALGGSGVEVSEEVGVGVL